MMSPESNIISCPDISGTDSHKINYYEWDNGSDNKSQKIVICVHGLTRNGRDFDYIARYLAERGYKVICPEMAGRGKSEWLKNPDLYIYPQYISDLIILINSLGIHVPNKLVADFVMRSGGHKIKLEAVIKFLHDKCGAVFHNIGEWAKRTFCKPYESPAEIYWIGTSMGGLIGMMIASSFPGLIKKMVMNDIGPFIPGSGLMRIGGYIGKNMDFDNHKEAEKYLKELMVSFGIRDEAHWQHIKTYSFYTGEDGKIHFSYDPKISNAFINNRGKMRKIEDIDLWTMWDSVDLPVLVLRGANSDLLLRETAERMAEKQDVTLVEIQNVGHAPMLMDENQIKFVADWLNGK